MKIYKKEFKSLAKKLVLDSTLQRIESQHFIFIRPDNGIITVKFKQVQGLTGYFTLDEFKDKDTLEGILNTLINELEKKNGK